MGTPWVLSLAASRTSRQFADGGGEALSLEATVGLGTDGLVIALLLVVLLAYLNVVRPREDVDPGLGPMIVSVTVPLLLTFLGIVLYESLRIVTT